MSAYYKRVVWQTCGGLGIKEDEVLPVINLMRDLHGTLDSLTHNEFRKEARDSLNYWRTLPESERELFRVSW